MFKKICGLVLCMSLVGCAAFRDKHSSRPHIDIPPHLKTDKCDTLYIEARNGAIRLTCRSKF